MFLFPLRSTVGLMQKIYKDIKRIVFKVMTGLTIIFFSLLLTGRIWCWFAIRDRIDIAKKQYPGKAEDALIAYLSDTTNSPQARSDAATWTLGQIRSRKALPVLNKLYKSDPEGKTCSGNHKYFLCQREIHKSD